ncbi:MAG: glycosyltransferase family 39 protein, partial [Bacteroidia bacterium]|nr:glycosyltransferase family 39 protein [Bacteroidia bacterium]
MNIVFKRTLGAAAFAAALYFPYFLHLDAPVLRLWDESRLACNALDQHQNGFGLVVRFEGKPDLWNTKPPLMIWLQAGCMRILGANELAVRLPAAAAGLGTSLLLFFALKGRTGAAAALILATMPGWVGHHGARTGDYDALLVFASTGFLLHFYRFLETKRRRALWTAAAFAATGLMTKGAALALCVPGAALAALAIRPRVFRNAELYLAAATALVPLTVYYLAREAQDPGYLQAVWNNEWGGRYFSTLEGHDHPWYFYFEQMFGRRLGLWKFALVFGILAFGRNPKLARYLWTASLTYLALVGGSQTKLAWYDLPVYPLWAALTALGWAAISSAKAKWALAAGLIVPAYFYVVSKVYHPKERPEDENLYALPRLMRQSKHLEYIAVGEHRQLIAFYAQLKNIE